MLAPSITGYFSAPSKSVWPSSLINILTVALNPPICQAADYWGRKWFLVILTLFGFVGSLVVSRAQSIATIITGYTLMGAAYGVQSLLFAVVSEVLPRKHRPIAQGSVNSTAGIGAVVGIVIGGSLLRNNNLNNYRIYYYIQAVIFALAAIGITFCYNPPPRELQTALKLSEKLSRLDWIGYILLTPGIILFTIALTWSQNPYNWTNAHILSLFIIGIILLILFGIYEWRFRSEGMIPHDLFRNRDFPISMLIVFTEGLSFFTCNAYFALEATTLYEVDLLMAGLRLSIVFLSSVVFAIVFGVWSQRGRVVRVPLIIGCTFLLLFYVLMATVTPSTPRNVFWGYPMFVGIGIGSILPTSMVSAQLSTPLELISITSGLMLTVRSLGGVIGLAINDAIYNHALDTNIPSKISAAVLPLGFPESSLQQLIAALRSNDQEAVSRISGITPQIIAAAGAALKQAYSIAFRNAWINASCFIFTAVVGKQ